MSEVRPQAIVVMGVAGSGKSTVAALLATMLGYQFQEGDLLHPPESVEKMRNGIPLTDADRAIWLNRVAAKIDSWRTRAQRIAGVVCCYDRIVITGTIPYLPRQGHDVLSLWEWHPHF